MIKGRAADIIKSFSREDLKQFGAFLKSPYFNSNRNLISLYSFIKKNISKIDNAGFTEELIYTEIFPGKEYNYGIFKNLLSGLHEQLCKYLSVNRFLRGKSEPAIPLLKELIERKLVKSAEKTIKESREYFQRLRHSVEEYHDEFTVEEYSNFVNYMRDQRWIQNLAKQENPLKISEKLLTYTLMRLLTQYLFFNYRMFVIKAKSSRLSELKKIIDIIYRYLHETLKNESPNVEVLYYVIQMREYPKEEERFHLAKEKLLQFTESIPPQVYRNAFSYLETYCLDKFEEGKDEYVTEVFLLYKILLKSPNAVMFGSISPGVFENIVTNGLLAGEVEYVEKFILEYEPLLPATQKNETLNFCLALLSFFKGKYDDAFRYLSNIEVEFLYVNLAIRKLYLMLYYETGQWDGLYSYIISFRAFLKNDKKIPAEIKNNYFNFIKYVYNIARLKERTAIGNKDTQVKVEFLIRQMKKNSSVFRLWLLQKASALLPPIH